MAITPPPRSIASRHVNAILAVLNGVIAARRLYAGTRVTSWYRSPRAQAALSGPKAKPGTSQHQIGTAIDVVPPRAAWSSARRFLQARGLVVIDEGDHLHVQAYRAGTWRP